MPRQRWPAAIATAALAVAALAWWTGMAHPTYIRQVLLTALLAPAALAAGLVAVGPSLQGLKLALRGRPAKVFLAAAWAHALLAWLSLGWTSSVGATADRAVALTTLAVWATGWLLAAAGPGWGRLARGHLAVMAAVAAVGALWHTGDLAAGAAPARLSVPIGNANTVAVLMIFPLCAAAALAVLALPRREAWPWPGYGVLAAGGCAAASFAFAGSRSGAVGLVAALALLVWLLAPAVAAGRTGAMKARLLACAGGLAVAAALAGAMYASDPSGFARRWSPARLWDLARTSSVGARVFGARAAAGVFREHPVGGAGAGTYMPAASRHIPRERYLGSYGRSFLNVAHNEYAETAAELGALGLAAFLAVLAAALAGAWRAAGRWRPGPDLALAAALGAGIAGAAVSSLADPSFRYWDFTGIFYAAAALAAAAGGRPEGEADAAEPAGGPAAQAAATTATTAVAAAGPPRRTAALAAVTGCVLLAAAATVFWSYGDAAREAAWKRARRSAAEAVRLRGEAVAASRAGDAAGAERLAARAGVWHAAAAGGFRVAVRTPGYFLSRALAHCEWIEETARAGHAAAALELAREFAALMPESPQALRYLAKAHFGCGRHPDALAALVRSGRLDPYTLDLYELLPRMFPHEPAADARLVEELRAGLGLGESEAAVLRSAAAAGRGDWPEAARAAELADPAEVSFLAAGYWRGRALLRAAEGRGDAAEAPAWRREAVEVLGRHLAGTPIHAEGHWLLARAHAEAAGRPGTEAELAALRRCVELDVEHEAAALRLVEVLAGLGRLDEALATSMDHLRIARDRTGFVLAAAGICVKQGRPEQAVGLLRAELRRRRNRDPRLEAALARLSAGGDGEQPGGLPEQPGQRRGVPGQVETPAH